MKKSYWIYIMCSDKNGTLYIGVTNDLIRRIGEHKNKFTSGFTEKYKIDKLVYVEEFHSALEAIQREKCIKKWNRLWKLDLIESQNPEWKDFYETIL